MVLKYKDPKRRHMILDAVKLGQCTFFPQIYEHISPSQTEGSSRRQLLDTLWAEYTSSSHTSPSAACKAQKRLLQMPPPGAGQLWVLQVGSEDECLPVGPGEKPQVISYTVRGISVKSSVGCGEGCFLLTPYALSTEPQRAEACTWPWTTGCPEWS